MDNETIVLLVIVAVIVLYLLAPYLCKSFSGFKSSKPTEDFGTISDSGAYAPGNPAINNEIAKTQINGLPDAVIPPWSGEYNGKYGEFAELNDGSHGLMGMGFNLCSKSCCSKQYPLPFSMPSDPLVCASEDKFSQSSYSCNNGWQDSGCLCMEEEQATFLNKRGNNS